MSQPLLVSNFSSSVSLPLSQFFSELRRVRVLLWFKLWVGLLWWLGGRNLPAMQETLVWSQDQEHTLEKGMAIPSSLLAWRLPWTEEPEWLCLMGSQRVVHDWVTNTSIKGMLWLIWLYIQTTKTLFISAIWLFWFLIIHMFNEVNTFNLFEELFLLCSPPDWLM